MNGTAPPRHAGAHPAQGRKSLHTPDFRKRPLDCAGKRSATALWNWLAHAKAVSRFACHRSPYGIALTLALILCGSVTAAARQIKLLAPDRYLPDAPFLVRVEVLEANGRRDWKLWDGEVSLSSDTPGAVLSTNRLLLYNGLGSTLLSVAGAGDFNLIASLDGLQTNRVIHTATNIPVTRVSGVLFGAAIWSGVILVTDDVTVPFSLTIQSNTIVLLSGVTNGVVGTDISINGGTISALGTEQHPITITCAESDLRYRWGQIRHNNAQSSLYRWTSIIRGGRATGEGHTGTAPAVRALGSKIVFQSCNITDHAEPSRTSPDFGTPGKILQSSLGSDLTFDNCLLSRARMGPELSETALLMTNSYVIGMYGVEDSDALFLDPQQAGQSVRIVDSVLADGDDDGIDTFSSIFLVKDSLIRDWRNPFEDAKGISIDNGEARIEHCLLVDNALGVSVKGGNGITVPVQISQSTILSQNYALGATNKNGTFPTIVFNVTNSILRGASDSVFTQYNPTDIHLFYCNLGEAWPGLNCSLANPMFVNATNHDFSPQPYSSLIDAGDPALSRDPDGSVRDVGYYTFAVPPPALGLPRRLGNGTSFTLSGYTNRDYAVEFSPHLQSWSPVTTVSLQNTGTVSVIDTNATNALRFYRAKLVPRP